MYVFAAVVFLNTTLWYLSAFILDTNKNSLHQVIIYKYLSFFGNFARMVTKLHGHKKKVYNKFFNIYWDLWDPWKRACPYSIVN